MKSNANATAISAITLALNCFVICQFTFAQVKSFRHFGGSDTRFQARTFRQFLVFDETIPSAMRDRSHLNLILNNFDRDFAEDGQKLGNRIVLPDGFSLVPTAADDRLVREINGTNFTPEDVRTLLCQMNKFVRDGDIVFAYIRCHGVTIGEREYILTPSPRWEPDATGGVPPNAIARDELRTLLEFPAEDGQRKTWLTVFITDACSLAAGPDRPLSRPPQGSIWKSLYFAHRGTVDIPTSMPRQPSFTIGGSLFLDAFARTFEEKRDDINRLPGALDDGVVEWSDEEYLRVLQEKLTETVQQRIQENSTNQRADQLMQQIIAELRERPQRLRSLAETRSSVRINAFEPAR